MMVMRSRSVLSQVHIAQVPLSSTAVMPTAGTQARATALALFQHIFSVFQNDFLGFDTRSGKAHRKHVCMRHRAGLLEVVLQRLPGGLLRQIVCKDALATAAAAAPAAGAVRAAPLPVAALCCLEIKVLPVLPARTPAFAA